jgi:hypothetical protein
MAPSSFQSNYFCFIPDFASFTIRLSNDGTSELLFFWQGNLEAVTFV